MSEKREKIKKQLIDLLSRPYMIQGSNEKCKADLILEILDEEGVDLSDSHKAFGEWISVEERLPEGITISLYLISRVGLLISIVAWFYPEENIWKDLDGEEIMSGSVTHWMPLPGPPGAINKVTKSFLGLVPDEEAQKVLKDAYRAVNCGFREQTSEKSDSKDEVYENFKRINKRLDALETRLFGKIEPFPKIDINGEAYSETQQINIINQLFDMVAELSRKVDNFQHTDCKIMRSLREKM